MIRQTRICILADPNSWHFLDLLRAADEQFELTSYSFEKLSALAGPPGFDTRHPLQHFNVIFARSMPAGSLQQVVFRMDVLLGLESNGLRIVNPPRTIEASVDKYLALTKMVEHSIPVPKTAVSQTVGDAVEQFLQLGSDVVVKPLFGSMGQGLIRIQNTDQAEATFATLAADGSVIYQQEFIDHGGLDLRLLVIGNEVLGMKRENDKNWITNISQGGRGIAYRPSTFEKELALGAAGSVGAIIAGVDLLYDRKTGQPFVVEINSAPAWREIGKVLEVDVAKMVLAELQRSSVR